MNIRVFPSMRYSVTVVNSTYIYLATKPVAFNKPKTHTSTTLSLNLYPKPEPMSGTLSTWLMTSAQTAPRSPTQNTSYLSLQELPYVMDSCAAKGLSEA